MVRPLRSTAITAASSLLRDGPPPCPGPVLCLSRFLPLEELPPPRVFHGDSRTTGSPVPRKSLNRARALFTPDAAGAVSRSPPGLSQDRIHSPGFDIILSISTLPQGFGFTRLHDPHLTQSLPRLFPRRSPPRLLTGAARGGLLPPPARRQRRACLHLSHSIASQQVTLTRPADYRSGHTYAAAFFRNSFSIFSSRVSRSSSRSRARSFTVSGGSSPACSRRYMPSRVAGAFQPPAPTDRSVNLSVHSALLI